MLGLNVVNFGLGGVTLSMGPLRTLGELFKSKTYNILF